MAHEENTNVTVPFRHAVDIYRVMFEQSEVVPEIELLEYGFPVESNANVRIFRGTLSKVARSLGLGEHQKTAATMLLSSMNCITRIKIGGPYSDGIWIMNYEPTPEQFIEFRQSNFRILRKTLPSKADLIISELQETKIKLREFESMFKSLEDRISSLENQVGHDIRPSSPVSEV